MNCAFKMKNSRNSHADDIQLVGRLSDKISSLRLPNMREIMCFFLQAS